MKKLEGIIIPAVTPFDETGKVRLDWLTYNYEKWNQTDVAGCMALGSNGEFRSLNDDESFEVINTASEVMSEDKLYIAGIGRESLYRTLRFLDKLQNADVRIDYVSVLTPSYFFKQMTDDALVDYFSSIANESKYPVLLYCAPSYANNVCISPEALKRLADHPNIAGIKDTSKDMMSRYMDAAGEREDFEIFAGSLSNILTCMRRGGKGGIISASNYFPQTCAKFTELVKTDGLENAVPYLEQIQTLMKETGALAGVAGVKATMNMMGFKAGVPRKPVLPCSADITERIASYIENNRELIID